MYFKKMVGKKCYLSPIDMEDVEKYTAWLNDYEVTRYLTMAPQMISLHAEKEMLLSLSKDHTYAIVTLEKDELIGGCGMIDVNNLHRTGEIGIFIGNGEYRNRGYGTEALKLLIDYSFKVLNLRNLMLKVYEFNDRAMHCYEKIGFRVIGRRRGAIERDLKVHDMIFMDILPEDFYR